MFVHLTLSEVNLIREALFVLVDIARDQGDTEGEAEASALYRRFLPNDQEGKNHG
jgi:hypothetical protein